MNDVECILWSSSLIYSVQHLSSHHICFTCLAKHVDDPTQKKEKKKVNESTILPFLRTTNLQLNHCSITGGKFNILVLR